MLPKLRRKSGVRALLFRFCESATGLTAWAAALVLVPSAYCEEAHGQRVQELFLTDSIYPQEKGEVQLTLAPAYSQQRDGSDWEIPLSIEYGLTDRWQLEIEYSLLKCRDVRRGGAFAGTGDLEFDTQYSFLSLAGSAFHVAGRFGARFPLGDVDRELSEGFIEYEPSIIMARDMPALANAQVFAQAGAGVVQRVRAAKQRRERESAAHEFSWSSGFFVPLQHCVATMEFTWRNNEWNHSGLENEMYLAPGIIWKFGNEIELGVGVPIGLNRESDKYRILTTATYEF